MIIIKPYLLDNPSNGSSSTDSLTFNYSLVEHVKVDTDNPDMDTLKRTVDLILNNALIGGIELGYSGNMVTPTKREMFPLNEESKKKMEVLNYLYDYDRYVLDPSRAVLIQATRNHAIPFQVLTNTRATLMLVRDLEKNGVDEYAIDIIERLEHSIKNARSSVISVFTKLHNTLYADKRESPNYTELAIDVFRGKDDFTSRIHYKLDKLPVEFHERFMDFLSVELDAWVCAIESILNKSIRMLATNEQAELTTLLEGFDDGSFELTDLEHIYQSRDEIRQEIDRIYKECRAYS